MRTAAAACLALVALAGPAAAGDDSCDGLWYERNAIYKDAGYCFKTTRAIRAFGNAGCSWDDIADVPLSARQRSAVSRIQRQERAWGCAR